MTSSAEAGRLMAIDLFAGMGGMTLGLQQAGFDVLAGLEVDELSARTYSRNHPNVYLVLDDIRRVDAGRFRRTLDLERGQLSLLGGCPPCQGFSRLTSKNGHHNSADERNNLVLDFVRFVAEFRPQVVMMENVPGLATDQRLGRVLARLDSFGYDVSDAVRVLDASDFGVPQRRKRMILLCTLRGPLACAAPGNSTPTVRETIEHLPTAGTSGDAAHDYPERRTRRIQRLIRRIPEDGGSRSDLPESQQLECHKRTSGFNDVYGRMSWDDVAPTITSGCFNPSKGRFLHPEEDRAITLREAMLLQGFPYGYEIELSRGKEAAARLIGNALPPPFVAVQARQAAEILSCSSSSAPG